MNQIISFHNEINKKKIIVIISILIIIFFIVIFLFLKFKKASENKKEEMYMTKTYSNSFISVELPKKYNFSILEKENYIFCLNSDTNLNIYIKKYTENKENISLLQIAEYDNKNYIKNFNKYANVSTISEFNYNDSKGYTYCFHYLDNDKKTAFYLQSFWIEANNKYYAIDIEFPLDKLQENSNLINEFFNTLIIK